VRPEGDQFAIAQSPSPMMKALRASLMSRLDRLGDAKVVAQRGAILGRTFSQELLRAVLDAESGDPEQRAAAWRRTEQCLSQLVEADVLRSVEPAPVEREPSQPA